MLTCARRRLTRRGRCTSQLADLPAGQKALAPPRGPKPTWGGPRAAAGRMRRKALRSSGIDPPPPRKLALVKVCTCFASSGGTVERGCSWCVRWRMAPVWVSSYDQSVTLKRVSIWMSGRRRGGRCGHTKVMSAIHLGHCRSALKHCEHELTLHTASAEPAHGCINRRLQGRDQLLHLLVGVPLAKPRARWGARAVVDEALAGSSCRKTCSDPSEH